MTTRVNRPLPAASPDERRPIARPQADVRMFGGWGPKF